MHDHEDHVEQFGRVASARKRRWNEAKKRTRSIVQPYSKVHALTNDPKERRNGEKTHTLHVLTSDRAGMEQSVQGFPREALALSHSHSKATAKADV